MAKNHGALPEHTSEALKAELHHLSDVYNATRSEIRNDEGKVVTNINYTIASAGIMIAISSFIASSQQYFLFLALPLPFLVLAFMNFEHNLGIAREGNYLRTIVYPRIREIITRLDNGSHDFGVNTLDWEQYWVKNNFPMILTIPVSASLFGLHFLFAIVPIIFFFYYKQAATMPLSALEIAFLVVDGIGYLTLIVYLIAFRIWSIRRRSG